MTYKSVTDNEIAIAFQGTNFGRTDYKALLAGSVFKKAVGYQCGHTITCIMEDIKLIMPLTGKITQRGRDFLYEMYNLKDSG